jgi:Ca-activated chloride channel family protein
VSFGSPLLLTTLLVVPALLIWLAVMRRRGARQALAFTNLDVLAGVASAGRSWRGIASVALLVLALVAAATATARPEARFTTVEKHSTVVLLVDVSGSMSARDVEPTRLDAAAAAMREFLDRVPPSVNVGLVQFSLDPEVLERPTTDRELVRESLGYLFPEAGTAIGDALARAVPLVRGKGAIVLLSDGKQNHGRLSALAGAARARAHGVRVDTIALGTPYGALYQDGRYDPVPPDPPLMRAIARATGGRTFTADNAKALSGVYSHLGGTVARETTTREIGSWFALAAGVLLLGALGLGRLWGSVLL